MIETASIIKPLAWDSGFFGVPSYYLKPENSQLVETALEKVKGPCFVQSSSLEPTAWLSEKYGFQYVGSKIEFEKKLVQRNVKIALEFANESDLENLSSYLQGFYRESRFFQDSHISEERSLKLFETWIVNAIAGKFDDYCLILRADNGKIKTFCTIKLLDNNCAKIGLFGVAPEYQGQGLADSMLMQVEAFLAQTEDVKRLFVSTQGENFAAQKVYLKFGFEMLKNEYWYHGWF
jgi:dTDP-4-amino-4,6-dideoxy-D-galactose acyltransferase